MPFRITRLAQADLDEVWNYIFTESGSETTADRALDFLGERFDVLAEWPRSGRRRDDLRRGYRSYAAGNYVVFYRLRGNTVVIQRVLHGRRDIAALLRER